MVSLARGTAASARGGRLGLVQGGGKYHVTYTPLVPGDHEVSIQVDGREIPNAPYMCVVKMNYAPQMKANEPLPCLALPCLALVACRLRCFPW